MSEFMRMSIAPRTHASGMLFAASGSAFSGRVRGTRAGCVGRTPICCICNRACPSTPGESVRVSALPPKPVVTRMECEHKRVHTRWDDLTPINRNPILHLIVDGLQALLHPTADVVRIRELNRGAVPCRGGDGGDGECLAVDDDRFAGPGGGMN